MNGQTHPCTRKRDYSPTHCLSTLFQSPHQIPFGRAPSLPSLPGALPGHSRPGASYELGFSPGGTSLTVVLHGIEAAKTSLLVACYEFTSRPIAPALIDAAHRGVRVAIVADYKASLERYSLIGFLAKSGIPVRRDSRYAIEHNKIRCH